MEYEREPEIFDGIVALVLGGPHHGGREKGSVHSRQEDQTEDNPLPPREKDGLDQTRWLCLG